MKKTKFNCVKMKRRGAEAIEKKTEDMTGEQEYKFWEEQRVCPTFFTKKMLILKFS